MLCVGLIGIGIGFAVVSSDASCAALPAATPAATSVDAAAAPSVKGHIACGLTCFRLAG